MSKPTPLSLTNQTGSPPSVRQPTSICAASRRRVNLRALESRLTRTCRRSAGSPCPAGMSRVGTSTRRPLLFGAQLGERLACEAGHLDPLDFQRLAAQAGETEQVVD